MGAGVIAQNLRALRALHGLAPKQVAEAAGLSERAYRALERSTARVAPRTLYTLAGVFNVPLRDLVAGVPPLREVRWTGSMPRALRARVLGEVASRLADMRDLEARLEIRSDPPLPRVEVGRAQPGRRRAILSAAYVRGWFEKRAWMRDLPGLIEAHGFKLLHLDIPHEGFSGLSVAHADGGPAIVVNTWPRLPVEHQIFSAARELGRLVMHPEAFGPPPGPATPLEEEEAALFASHFLMPSGPFMQEWERTYGLALFDRVLRIKRWFEVSYRIVLDRLEESPSKPGTYSNRFHAEYRKRHGVDLGPRQEPDPLAPDAFPPSDRLLGLVRRAIEREAITLARAAEILRLSIEQIRELAQSWVP